MVAFGAQNWRIAKATGKDYEALRRKCIKLVWKWEDNRQHMSVVAVRDGAVGANKIAVGQKNVIDDVVDHMQRENLWKEWEG